MHGDPLAYIAVGILALACWASVLHLALKDLRAWRRRYPGKGGRHG